MFRLLPSMVPHASRVTPTRCRRAARWLAVCLAAAVVSACGEGQRAWERATPESQGLLAGEFERWTRDVEARDTAALLVIRNGKLVHEWYASGSGAHEPEHIASMAKGVAGGLALAVLATEGKLELDVPVADTLDVWRTDAQRRPITPRQLATHSSGLANAISSKHDPAARSAWEKAFWQLDRVHTPGHVALTAIPLEFEPGRGFRYSNPGYALLSVVLAGALQNARDATLPAWLAGRVFEEIGVAASDWTIGYGRVFDFEGLDVSMTWGGAQVSPDALARLGTLLLRRGDWDGREVLSPAAVDTLVAYAGTPVASGWPAAGLGWWSNQLGVWPRLPRDAYLAFGAGQRILLVVPSLDLVVVRLGTQLDPAAATDAYWEPLERLLLNPLADAFPRPPVPRSDALSGAWFAPVSSLECSADGSDNWPLTELADGSLFTSYGDGGGFAPGTGDKLSLGFAHLSGGPQSFAASNVRSASGERSGDGATGAKASGMLAVGDVLYMWVRNLENSQLAWSSDAGATWNWGLRFAESFGSPTFLNAGHALTGSADDFVYVYSQDGPSAYEADDAIVLARVPGERIRDREAYEFFAGLAPTSTPSWSARIEDRVATLAFPRASRRSEVIFNAGLGRYLMALGFDSKGGWGLFDAPQPWGPWSTVYFTRRWDLGDTHSYRLPTPWISPDGRDLHLVVSGRNTPAHRDDAFCVRKLRLTPAIARASALN